MDDLSRLSQGLGGAGNPAGSEPQGITPGLANAVQSSGGLDALTGKLRQGGLGDEVDSWVSSGPNKPVPPDRLGEALGPDTVQKLSVSSGMSVMSLLPLLANFLPQIIDMLTPDGKAPAGGLDAAAGGGSGLGGLLGGVLGGSAGPSSGTGGSGLDDMAGGLGSERGGGVGGERGG
ncbi:MAG: DUF937 domain-containing protein, partial [Chloroflexi bacterium]|nr:DUF937 domain-containing protein [Chloroflexota bacterium]